MAVKRMPTTIEETKARPDYGRRRWVTRPSNFDFRANILNQKIGEEWSEEQRKAHLKNCKRLEDNLLLEFGASDGQDKIDRFKLVGALPFSVVANHNSFLNHARTAYVSGAYYAALTSACALGERILNHLILELRTDFSELNHYENSKVQKRVLTKNSFDNWEFCVAVLRGWDIFFDTVADDFLSLGYERHRAIHFNRETYETVKDDALTAVRLISQIVEKQFGTFGKQPWIIKDTPGNTFVKKDWESKPFVTRFLLPNSDCVGHLFTFRHRRGIGFVAIDFPDYGAGAISDEEFARAFRERKPAETTAALEN